MKSNLEEQQYRYTLTKISHLEQPVTVYYKEKFLFVECLLDLSQIMLFFFLFLWYLLFVSAFMLRLYLQLNYNVYFVLKKKKTNMLDGLIDRNLSI